MVIIIKSNSLSLLYHYQDRIPLAPFPFEFYKVTTMLSILHWLILRVFCCYEYVESLLFHKFTSRYYNVRVETKLKEPVKIPRSLFIIAEGSLSDNELNCLLIKCKICNVKLLVIHCIASDERIVGRLLLTKENLTVYENDRLCMKKDSTDFTVIVANYNNSHKFYVSLLRKHAIRTNFAPLTETNLAELLQPFETIDLVISTQRGNLDLSPVMAITVGFAQTLHVPGEEINNTLLQRAFNSYSACKQNFGK